MSSIKRIAFRERALIWAMRNRPGKAMPGRRPAGKPRRIRRPSDATAIIVDRNGKARLSALMRRRPPAHDRSRRAPRERNWPVRSAFVRCAQGRRWPPRQRFRPTPQSRAAKAFRSSSVSRDRAPPRVPTSPKAHAAAVATSPSRSVSNSISVATISPPARTQPHAATRTDGSSCRRSGSAKSGGSTTRSREAAIAAAARFGPCTIPLTII